MTYVGSWKIDDLLTFYANTTRVDTGNATDADSVPTYRVYEDETGTPLLTGSMALLDSSNTAGFYSEQITLSAANGFEKGKCYAIYIAATVNSIAGATHRTFQIQAEVAVASYNSGLTPLQPTTGVGTRTLDVTATGAAGIDWANVEGQSTAVNLSATNIDTDQVVASVTGAVGSVTGNVGGNVAGSVASVTGNVGGNVVGSVASVTGNVGGNLVGSVGSLSAGAQTNVSNAVGTREAETGVTYDQSLRLANSANGAITAGMDTATGTIRDLANTKDRVTATLDGVGNRTAVSLDLT